MTRDHKIRIIVSGSKTEAQRSKWIMDLIQLSPHELNQRLALRFKVVLRRKQLLQYLTRGTKP